MSGPNKTALAFVRRMWRAQRGATAVTVALFMTVIIGMCGFVIDLGHVAYVQRQLQSSSDAAALAGANEINCCATSKAVSSANLYSAVAGDNNVIKGVTSTMVSGYPLLKCFTSTNVSCTLGTGVDKANGIVVKQTANVPMWFSSIFGLTSIPINATATAGVGGTGGASSPGSTIKNIDFEIVIDTTASMNTADSGCSVTGATRLGCAEAGLQGIMKNQLNYKNDQMSLLAFPGPTAATVANDYNCSGKNPSIVPYAAATNYSVLGLGSDFKTKASGSNLNTSSNAVRAVGAGLNSSGGSCPGMQAPGGEGTYYAGAITAAVNDINTNGRSGAEHVIIILSDGDANAKSGSQISSGLAANQCAQAVAAAQAATKAGDIVIPIAYGSSTSTSSSCSTDGGKYSACSALAAMASAPQYFLAVNQGNGTTCNEAGAPTVTDVPNAFSQAVGASLGTVRLLPDNTQ